MDGNSRWARAQGRDVAFGHEAGVRALQRTLRACLRHGVRALTVYAFSQENWRRGGREVTFLLGLIGRALDEQQHKLEAEGVRLQFIGDAAGLPPQLRQRMRRCARRGRGCLMHASGG